MSKTNLRDYVDSIWDAVKEWETRDPLLENFEGFVSFYNNEYRFRGFAITKIGEYMGLMREVDEADISMIELIFRKSHNAKLLTIQAQKRPKRTRVKVEILSESQAKHLRDLSLRLKKHEKSMLKRDR